MAMQRHPIEPARAGAGRPASAVRGVSALQDEHQEQVALFQWARYAESQWPELALLHAIPNGGHRHKAVAARMRAEGVRRGVPDICLPVPRHGWHGLYLELKTRRGRMSPDQGWWLRHLREQGYFAVLCRGSASAQQTIADYLSLPTVHPAAQLH